MNDKKKRVRILFQQNKSIMKLNAIAKKSFGHQRINAQINCERVFFLITLATRT